MKHEIASLTIEQLKKLAIDALEAMKARDITVLDVREISTITDYMVIASGTSTRQVKALAASVAENAKEHGCIPLGIEGEQVGEWALVDLADVVVHVMLPEVRAFYNLEKLWGEASQPAPTQAAAQHMAGRRKSAAKRA